MRPSKRSLLRLLSVLVVVLCLSTAMVAPASAYKTDKGDNNDAHDLITRHAVAILLNDGHSAVANEINAHIGDILGGVYHIDHVVGWGFKHFHHPDTHKGLKRPFGIGNFESAADFAQELFDDAVDLYLQGKTSDAYYKFGEALHLVEDLTVPQHAALTIGDNHKAYEGYVEDHLSYVYLVNSGGIYTFATRANHYSPSTPWGWVDYAAHKSIQYFELVKDGGDDEFDTAARELVPWAVRLTAGFMKFFYDQTHISYTPPPGGEPPVLVPYDL